MGKLKSIDRFEIEGYHNIRNLIIAYAGKKFSEGEDITPLSIAVFGSPGSGKSYGVKQIAKSLRECNIKTDTVNVAQISSDDELGAAFQKVRDIVFEDKLPLVFLDEFDSGDLQWLKNFLMPMQDGKFKDASGEHPLGKCILVFAGGTASTFKDFIAPMSSADEQVQRRFKNVKGPDFASRIKGVIDIAGPNRRDDSDNAYILRRALLLRGLCENDERLKTNIKAGKEFVDENIIRSMLYVPEYKHGARSMETVLKMSKIEKGVWLPSGLPMGNQMSVHLNDRKFTDILLINVLEQSLEGKIARAIHEKYIEYMTEKQRKQPNRKPWEELAIEFKLSNLNQARSYSEKLALIKCEMALKDENKEAVTAFTDDEVLLMAKQEHQRWMNEKTEDGWIYAPIRDDKKKHHNCFAEWDKLSEEVQNWDKEPIRNMIEILKKVGYGVYKVE
ncbi:MAG: AAA family ATPase [Prevotellaceae bacterium]|nr:AAA family ATPase [Prevotellaceae bacterium]